MSANAQTVNSPSPPSRSARAAADEDGLRRLESVVYGPRAAIRAKGPSENGGDGAVASRHGNATIERGRRRRRSVGEAENLDASAGHRRRQVGASGGEISGASQKPSWVGEERRGVSCAIAGPEMVGLRFGLEDRWDLERGALDFFSFPPLPVLLLPRGPKNSRARRFGTTD